MYKVVIDDKSTFTFEGIDAFRESCRTDLRYTVGMAKGGFSRHDSKWYKGDDDLISHTKVGDRVKGETSR